MSIPGTGMYNRQYLKDGSAQSQAPAIGCAGCLKAIFGALLALVFLAKVVESGETSSLIVVAVLALSGYVLWRVVRAAKAEPAIDIRPEAEAPVTETGHGELRITTQRSPDPEIRVPKPAPAAPVALASLGPLARPARELDEQTIIDPQFTCATGLVTIDILREKTKELVESLEPMLKAGLRNIRQSSNARILLEADIREIIIRSGCSNGRVSRYAAHLYLELFRRLHPRQYAHWKTQNALEFLQGLADEDQEKYLGVPKKPFTLEVTERLDATCATGITKPTSDIFLIIAYFAASVDGKVAENKAAEIGRMKEIFENQGAAGA